LSADARPGQFVMVRCGTSYDPYLRRPLPIHRFREQGLALFFRPSDPALAWLADRHLGDAVDLLGPCGRGLELGPAGRNLGLIAQGMGIAPLLSLLDRASGNARLVVEAPTPGQVYPRALLPPQVEYVPCVGREQHESFIRAIEETCRWSERIYAAGPEALYRQLRQAVAATRLELTRGLAQVWVEAEMGCGRGICQACAVETRHGPQHVCLEGPFFDLADWPY